MPTVSERLVTLRGNKSRRAFAEELGAKESTLRNYEQGTTQPTAEFLEHICNKLRISPQWLLLGHGPMKQDEPDSPSSPKVGNDVLVGAPRQIPIIGLAACGLAGWFNPSSLALTAPLPLDYPRQNMLAVIAVGMSMVPEGIRQGFVLYCDFDLQPLKNDVIFIEQTDGKSAVKRYVEKEGEWLLLEGWLDPDEKGDQKLYRDKILISAVKRMGTVVFVKRRA